MSDLIKRSDAIDAIKKMFAKSLARERAIDAVNSVPSAEPKIIRCKDCKHQEVEWHEDRRRKDGGYMIYWCNLCEDPFVAHGVCGEPKGYCSRAERRDQHDI